MDYNPNVMKWERENLHCYSCIGITPLHPDGCMILVWTEGMRKKFRTAEEIEFDEKRSKKKIDPKPGQYFLFIPKGTMLILPGDIVFELSAPKTRVCSFPTSPLNPPFLPLPPPLPPSLTTIPLPPQPSNKPLWLIVVFLPAPLRILSPPIDPFFAIISLLRYSFLRTVPQQNRPQQQRADREADRRPIGPRPITPLYPRLCVSPCPPSPLRLPFPSHPLLASYRRSYIDCSCRASTTIDRRRPHQ